MKSSILILRLLVVLGLVLLGGCSSDDGPTQVPAGDDGPEIYGTDSVTARVLYPGLDLREATRVPATVDIGFEGSDADAPDLQPARYRYLLIPAVWEGSVILVRDQYDHHCENLVTWDHPEWSAWLDYPADTVDRIVSFDDLEIGGFYLFAVQMMDDSCGVSEGREYAVEVMNMFAADGF